MSDSFRKALLEFGRTFLLTFASSATTALILVTQTVEFKGQELLAIAAASALSAVNATLKAVDKFLHLVGKEEEARTGSPSKKTLGLTRF